ncbi:Hypothetical predicted protein [Olea europaea subsp. europaea]|uniref:Uncharacterized protein n=1 Tax=Olea europaea subsp. europaea TaxID=158383 RepID=A0A8S0QYE1_OLEEU|nr:Hypothetical predicted protein [Olea europaea subsp. europaea]
MKICSPRNIQMRSHWVEMQDTLNYKTTSKSESKTIWVYLECGNFSCRGVGFETNSVTGGIKEHSLSIGSYGSGNYSIEVLLIWGIHVSLIQLHRIIRKEAFQDDIETVFFFFWSTERMWNLIGLGMRMTAPEAVNSSRNTALEE